MKKNWLTRWMSVLLALSLLPSCALSEGWMSGTDEPDAVENMTQSQVYNAADSVGNVVNGGNVTTTEAQEIVYSFTPVDVVLVLDRSGSMSAANRVNNKSLLSYAQDAAIAFCQTLFSINPASRISVISYDEAMYVEQDFAGFGQENALNASIRGIRYGGTTNIGGGIAMASQMMAQGAIPGRQQVIVVLSDGLANVSGNGMSPVDYTISEGRNAARNGMIYTIGLVGLMSEGDKRVTRQTLGPGYETRYFEVDFDNVGDIDLELASIFMSIAMSASMPEGESDALDAMRCYRLRVDGSMDLYIPGPNGEYLSSAAYDYCDRASFGSFSVLGDNMDEKMVMMYGNEFSIRLHGNRTDKGSYSLSSMQGRRATPSTLCDTTVQAHPAMYQSIDVQGNDVTVFDISYDPLDIYATDPFTGQRTRGLEIPDIGTVTGSVTLRAYPDNNGEKITPAKAGDLISVLAEDDESGFSFIGYVDEKGYASRGWMLTKYVKNSGYVPEMIWMDQEAAIERDTVAHRVPSRLAPEAGALKAGQKVKVVHAERDTLGNEWLYVQMGSRKALGYVPAVDVTDWQEQTGPDFRLGYAIAQHAWRTVFGGGYTETMWAIPSLSGSGVTLSGRTTSSGKPFGRNRGDRDAFALELGADGVIGRTVTAGGSAVDSYHCIIPSPDGGYYVSGITRSNDVDFKNTWDESSTSGQVKSTTTRSNALIGRLNEDMSIRWLKTFGSGNSSYGFDVVVELADGNIAGAGWMTESSKATIRGYGRQDFYVVVMTPDGDVIQEANFGGWNDDVPDSAVATPNGGMILVGSTGAGNSADAEIWVLDENLNVISQQIIGGSGRDVFDNIRAMDDGTYLVTGFTSSPNGDGVGTPKGGLDFWAMNIDELGRPIWIKRYGGSKDEELCGTAVLQDGSCLLVGSTKSSDGDVRGAYGKDQDGWAACIDSRTGRLLWQYATGFKGNDSFNAGAVDPSDGAYVLNGLCQISGNNAKGIAVKLLPFGTIE